MGKQIKVTSFEEMGKAVTSLRTSATTYRKLYKELLDCAKTMGEAWTGADNQAFVSQILGCADELEGMAIRLDNAAEALDTQKGNYEVRQEVNVEDVKKLQN
ncbi:MAG: hypothetical protein IKQ71_04035 [Lachnospiraceae bacterium]|nr:hypothetical protein [Lachnospiraceae bacterium]